MLVQLTSKHLSRLNLTDIHSLKTPNIDSPKLRARPGPMKWKDTAGFAEIMFGDAFVETVDAQLIKRRKHLKFRFGYTIDNGCFPGANRTIANNAFVEIQFCPESNFSAVARALVFLFHAIDGLPEILSP